MTLSKMLRAVVVGSGLLFAALASRPAVAADSYAVMESKVVQISTSMVTGATQLLTASTSPAYVVLFSTGNGTSGESVAIAYTSSVSTNVVSGSFRFPTGSVFELRDFKGALWAVSVATSATASITPFNVNVLRKR